ncbi:BamA/TamA family outer membrane protein [Pusillimonas sp. TS35]|uniref:autotransporter assembly complex protein TamA n=1 Tax=Paracandidimonas lactea TaxID=2895524 RepID=UPI00136EC279|nr:BamA/TamA family outer membrane protein [Paracandidimonas lactea]MYN14637.1 BamA/TamA family outer membrane protein [Pusillimonas sp. TS35]
MRRGAATVFWFLAGLSLSAAAAERPEVIIDPGGVPPQALTAINGAVEAITRLAEDQDGGEVTRLRRRAHDATVSALETQGYFSPVVTLEVGEDIGGETWDITIEPGLRTEVESVQLDFKGQITQPRFEARLIGLRRDWPLREGMPFINKSWGTAKENLLDGVSRKDFYFARYVSTQATVDADRAKARLHAEVDSGPRAVLGPMTITGLKRVPPRLIRRYVVYEPGDAYDQDKLDDWQQSLQTTSFFRGAFVTLNADQSAQRVLEDGSVELPVRVDVTEAPARRFTTSIGADSDHGIRVEGLYRQNVVFGQPVWIETGAGVDKDRQRVFFDVHLPPSRRGHQDSVGVLYEHSDIEGLDNSRVGLGFKRSTQWAAGGGSRVDYESEWGAVAAYDKTRISGASEFEVPSLTGTYRILRRDVDKKYDPREGNLIELGVGLGVTLDRGERFSRAGLRAQKWWPVGRRDVVTLRGEVGKVWTQTDRLPQDFGYRTGGARTIRGYRYLSIGEQRGDAVIGANALAVASVEYTHYFTDTLGMNLFIDAGDAAASFGAMDWHVGVGTGLAVRTPAGPFFVDLAYGQRDKKLRLHFSLGIAF